MSKLLEVVEAILDLPENVSGTIRHGVKTLEHYAKTIPGALAIKHGAMPVAKTAAGVVMKTTGQANLAQTVLKGGELARSAATAWLKPLSAIKTTTVGKTATVTTAKIGTAPLIGAGVTALLAGYTGQKLAENVTDSQKRSDNLQSYHQRKLKGKFNVVDKLSDVVTKTRYGN